MSKLISIVLAIRDLGDREYIKRLEYCLTSALIYQSMPVSNVVVVDSSPELVFRRRNMAIDIGAIYIHAPSDEFNLCKSLNIGLRESAMDYIGADYIGVTDVDVIFSPFFFEMTLSHIKKKMKRVFIIGGDVRYLKQGQAEAPYQWHRMTRKSKHTDGALGIQLAHKSWWQRSGGYDESAVGTVRGIDTDVYNKAMSDGLRICRVQAPIFHQWHPTSKFKNVERQRS